MVIFLRPCVAAVPGCSLAETDVPVGCSHEELSLVGERKSWLFPLYLDPLELSRQGLSGAGGPELAEGRAAP